MKKLIVLVAVCIAAVTHSQNVDPFTGSFGYNVPLLHVPSNKGAGVSIDANYSAGIQMSQVASEMGLGWSLSAGGAIYRSLVGYPDDTKNYTVPGTAVYKNVSAQGALYPMSNGAITDFDLDRTFKGNDLSEFIFPGFDNFSVSGPGFSGQMKLAYLKFYSYKRDTGLTGEYGPDSTHLISVNPGYPGSGNTCYQRPQFHFVNDFADTLISRHYPVPTNSTTTLLGPNSAASGYGYPGAMSNNFDPYIGYHQNGSTIQNQNFDPATGHFHVR